MLLVIDVGNTNTSLGIYEVGRLRASWRLTTRREQTADEWGVFIQTLLATRGIAWRSPTWCRPSSRRSSGCATGTSG